MNLKYEYARQSIGTKHGIGLPHDTYIYGFFSLLSYHEFGIAAVSWVIVAVPQQIVLPLTVYLCQIRIVEGTAES
jgi:hypothetical protein